MFIFVGKMGIVMVNLITLYGIMKYVTKDTEEVESIVSPMIVVGVISYINASIFLGLFDEAVLSLMMSYAVDLDIGGGSINYGPPTFHDNVTRVSGVIDEDVKKKSNVMK